MDDKKIAKIVVSMEGEYSIARVQGKLEDVSNMLQSLFELIKKDDDLVRAAILADLQVGLIPRVKEVSSEIVGSIAKAKVNSKPRTVN